MPGRLGLLCIAVTMGVLTLPVSITKATRPGEPVMARTAPPAATQPAASQSASSATRPSDQAGGVRTLLGRVVDTAGEGVAGATIELRVAGQDTNYGRVLRTRTDKDGRFRLDETTGETATLGVSKEGFRRIDYQPIPITDEEHVITLLRKVVFKGRIIDAQTGKPVPDAKVTLGLSGGRNSPVFWKRSDTQTAQEGRFEYAPEWQEQCPVTRLLVEADGYAPATSREFTTEEGEVTCDFRMEPAKTTVKRLVSPDGKPVADAEVLLATASGLMSISDGKSGRPDTVSMRTDADGQFRIWPQSLPFCIAVADQRGYVEATQEQIECTADVVLRPWARIEGQLMLGGKPECGDVSLTAIRILGRCQLLYTCKASTDVQGRFVFDRVPPGRSFVFRRLQVGEELAARILNDHGTMVDLKPGETARPTIGGQGRPIVGRLTRDGKPFRAEPHLVIEAKVSPPYASKMPEAFLAMNLQERQAWLSSAEGQAFSAEREKVRSTGYWAVVNKDGTFRVEDVPEGRYQFLVVIREAFRSPQWPFGRQVGQAARDFAVPPMPGNRSDEPLDLGDVEVHAAEPASTQPATPNELAVGQVAPSFEARTLDGKPLRLADYRGKVVLLDFWAAWCGPCVADIPHLKAVYDAFGKDSRFAMISLSLDEDAQAQAAFVRRNDVHWNQGFLGDWKTTKVPAEYGVVGIPAVFLIDPEGKIIARDLAGPRIVAAVRAALSPASKAATPED